MDPEMKVEILIQALETIADETPPDGLAAGVAKEALEIVGHLTTEQDELARIKASWELPSV